MKRLTRQTVSDIEVILVVDYSDQETLNAIGELPMDRLITLSHEKFNHAYSTNLGVASSHARLVAITNGHSLPISERWLESGTRHFVDPRVAGVTGLYTPFPDGSAWEKFYNSHLLIDLYRRESLRRLLHRIGHYPLSSINCMIRKDLWEAYPFDESLPQCEDDDWGMEMRARGYLIVVDPDFSVYHSHGEGLREIVARRKRWRILTRALSSRPRPRFISNGPPRKSPKLGSRNSDGVRRVQAQMLRALVRVSQWRRFYG